MTNVAVVGATGYAGAELANILKKHPHASVTGLYSSADFSVDAVANSGAEVVFLATPNEVSAEVVPHLLDRNLKVIDLSGAFRLASPSLYPSWYGFTHEKPELLGEAVYGLPEWCNGELKKARLIANPGCYATAALLALAPLRDVIDGAVVDAKSGMTGAGRALRDTSHAGHVLENFSPYAVGAHRHAPEIAQTLGFAVTFVPHLLPVRRGLLATCYVQSDADLRPLLEGAYTDSEVVRVLPEGVVPELSRVQGTDAAELGLFEDGATGTTIVICALDNLGKGAAGQAVQNANIALGLEQTLGLRLAGVLV